MSDGEPPIRSSEAMGTLAFEQELRVDSGRVLLVDDDTVMAELLAIALEKHGFTVRLAGTAVDAMELARRFDPHVVILDLHLADGELPDGHDLGLMLREQSTRSVQLIVLTADDAFSAHARSELLEFAAHLVKPVPLRDLVRLIELLVPLARRPARGGPQ